MAPLVVALLAAPAHAGVLGPWLDEAPPDSAADTDAMDSLADAPLPPCGPALRDGVQLPDMPDLFVRINPQTAWGTEYMVDTLIYASEQMAWIAPGVDPIAIGDISSRYGGRQYGHKTHNAGIDADVGLYSFNGVQESGRNGFVEATPRTLDAEHTWDLAKTFFDTGRVDFILLDQALIDTLKRYVEANDLLSADEVTKMFPPPSATHLWDQHGYFRNAPNHKNHMHVHVMCVGTPIIYDEG